MPGVRSQAVASVPGAGSLHWFGLQDLVRRGVIRKGQTVVLLHTGGLPALFAYTEALAAAGLTTLQTGNR